MDNLVMTNEKFPNGLTLLELVVVHGEKGLFQRINRDILFGGSSDK